MTVDTIAGTVVEEVSDLSGAGLSIGMANFSDVATDVIYGDPKMRQLAQQLTRWVDNARNSGTGRGGMFDRTAYSPPDNPYDEMRAARHAMRYDSIVSGTYEVTESFAFQGLKWEGQDPDEADAFNQLSTDMNLDAVMRRMWHDEYAYSQFVSTKIWDTVEYTVRGQTKSGNRRKKTFRFYAPVQLKLLDPMKVVPVGAGPLAAEQLAWQATPYEIEAYQASFSGLEIDPLQMQFFAGQYMPGPDEKARLVQLGVDPNRLLLMDPNWSFRHTLTKPDYERFADVRLKSCFTILDLKQQVMQSDRAMLIGAANYILLIRKGSDQLPAQQPEIDNLREGYNFIAKLPVIISDHRLSIDIISPKTDTTLDSDKYNLLDGRLMSRLLGTLTAGTSKSGSRSETQESISAAVARVMENRRHMMRRTLELHISRAIVNHPRNRGVFSTEPNLVFTPRNIALAMDAAYTQALLNLRTQRELSRETTLEFFGLDEATEAMRMEMEAELFDDIFKTAIPFNSPANQPGGPNGQQQPNGTSEAGGGQRTTPNGTPEAPGVSGARGGRPRGGGRTPQSPAAQVKPRTGRGNPTTRARASEEDS